MNLLRFDKTETTRDDFYISLLIVVTLAYNVVTLSINTVVNLVLPNTPLDTMLCMMVYAFCIFMALPGILRRMKMADIAFLLAALAIYLFSMMNRDLYPYASEKASYFFLQILPLFFMGRAIRNERYLEKLIAKITPFVILFAVVYYIIVLNKAMDSGDVQDQDNMAFAYYLLPFSLFSLFGFLEKKSIVHLVFLLVSVVLQFLTGTRGPLLCIFIALLLYLFLYKSTVKTKVFTILIGAALLVYLSSELFTEHIKLLADFFEDLGISNRIVDKLVEGEMTDSSGRDRIQDIVVAGILANPLFGNGLFGDRYLLQAAGSSGTYAHNIVLEILCHFGLLFGVAILVAVVLLQVYALKKRNMRSCWILMLTVAGFIKLFMSNSYIIEPVFFLLIGSCCNVSFAKKEKEARRFRDGSEKRFVKNKKRKSAVNGNMEGNA